jgi:DNA-binding transcriptional LysR family regulator
VLPQLTELSRAFKGLELKFLRGAGPEIGEALKKGAADLAVGGPLRAEWERLDSWPLFTEGFVLAVNEKHRLANSAAANVLELKSERLIYRSHCESAGALEALLAERGLAGLPRHETTSEADVAALLMANVGVAIVPVSAALPANLRHIRIEGLDHKREVSVYGVAGRARSPVAGMLLKLLRATNWSAYSAA